jgi:hypothetical protein
MNKFSVFVSPANVLGSWCYNWSLLLAVPSNWLFIFATIMASKLRWLSPKVTRDLLSLGLKFGRRNLDVFLMPKYLV